MTTLRAFIAIDLPPDLRSKIESLSGRLRHSPGQECLRFVPASGIHLTLKFLGDIHLDLAAELHSVLDHAAGALSAFDVHVRGIGCFPDSRRARVLWIGLEEPQGRVEILQRAIEDGCVAFGLPAQDRPFSAHLTLGRVRREAGPEAVSFVRRVLEDEQALDLGEMPVDAVHLFRSELRPSGAVYTRLHSASLRSG